MLLLGVTFSEAYVWFYHIAPPTISTKPSSKSAISGIVHLQLAQGKHISKGRRHKTS
jgi:hypothetical protein